MSQDSSTEIVTSKIILKIRSTVEYLWFVTISVLFLKLLYQIFRRFYKTYLNIVTYCEWFFLFSFTYLRCSWNVSNYATLNMTASFFKFFNSFYSCITREIYPYKRIMFGYKIPIRIRLFIMDQFLSTALAFNILKQNLNSRNCILKESHTARKPRFADSCQYGNKRRDWKWRLIWQ